MAWAMLLSAQLAAMGSARAEIEQPYCQGANGGYGSGFVTCGFATMAQCRETILGMGGWCQVNPHFRERAPARDARRAAAAAGNRDRRLTMGQWISTARAGAVLAGASAIAAAVAVPNAAARTDYPYCAVSRGADIIYEDCSYGSFAACLEEIRGLGGYCRPNARYVAPPVVPQPDRRQPRRPR